MINLEGVLVCGAGVGMRQLREEKYSAGVVGTWIKVGAVFVRGEGKYGKGVEKTLEKGEGV